MFEMCGCVFESVSIATSSFMKKGPSVVIVLVLLQVDPRSPVTYILGSFPWVPI